MFVCLLSACAARAPRAVTAEPLPQLPAPDPPVVGEPLVVKDWPSLPPSDPSRATCDGPIDLEDCLRLDADARSVDVRVTFSSNGSSSAVVIQSALGAEATACVHSQLARLRVRTLAKSEATIHVVRPTRRSRHCLRGERDPDVPAAADVGAGASLDL
jgi:hypothetical protein